MQALFARFRRHCFLRVAIRGSNTRSPSQPEPSAVLQIFGRFNAPSTRTMAPTVKKVMTQPISVIFRMLQNKQRLQIWLYENTSVRFEGKLVGFDEYMNVVLDDAEEVDLKRGKRTSLGRMLLKGDAITLIQSLKG